MSLKSFLIPGLLVAAVIISGCGSQAPNNAVGNAPVANNPLETKTPPPDQTLNNAPTLAPVFKAYCEAMVKKDEAALRRIYAAETIKLFEEQMKEDNIKSLTKFLEDDGVTGKICEVRNEQITGDTAIAEIRADAYPNGLKVVFLKEKGEWKLTNKSPGSITQTAPSTNVNK